MGGARGGGRRARWRARWRARCPAAPTALPPRVRPPGARGPRDSSFCAVAQQPLSSLCVFVSDVERVAKGLSWLTTPGRQAPRGGDRTAWWSSRCACDRVLWRRVRLQRQPQQCQPHLVTHRRRPLALDAALVGDGHLAANHTPAGGLERYVTADSGLLPVADYRTAQITRLRASGTVPDDQTPADGTTVHVLAAVTAQTTHYAPRHEEYPITLTVRSGRWTVPALDYAPLLAPDGDLTPVLPGPVTAPR